MKINVFPIYSPPICFHQRVGWVAHKRFQTSIFPILGNFSEIRVDNESKVYVVPLPFVLATESHKHNHFQSLNATSRLGLTDKLLSNLKMNLIRKFLLHKKETTMICKKVFRNMSQKRYKFQHLGRISIALTYFPAEWKVYGLL